MDNNQDELAKVDEDDDILYEDDEDSQELEGRTEGSMEDGGNTKSPHMNQKVQTTDHVEDESNLEGQIDYDVAIAPYGGRESNSASEQPQTESVGTIGHALKNDKASAEHLESNLEQDLGLVSHEDSVGDDAYDQGTNQEHTQAEDELNQNYGVDFDFASEGVLASKSHDFKSNNEANSEALGSDAHSDKSLPGDEGGDAPALQTPILHTVKIQYLDTEMCLFPPTHEDETEMFFLQDVSLAHEGLDQLLGACRDVLANAIGQDDELVLDIASLGLHISEGSRYATQITLSQIIDVYIALGHNDHPDSIEPLYCSLSSRVCLASQYAYLLSAANEGKTLTQILEANAFAPGEGGESGEGREDRLGHEQIETQIQEKSADLIQESAKNCASPKPEQDPLQQSTDDDFEAVPSGSSDEIKGRPTDDSRSGPDENSDGEPKETERQSEKQSTNSAVKGNSHKLEDDHENSPEICLKPGICSCSKCANTSTDDAALVSDKHDNVETTEDLFDGGAQAPATSDLVDSNAVADENHDEKPDVASSFQGSVSSRTLEAETTQLDEDIFSEDGGQTFEDETANFAENQPDDVEDFQLEEDYDEAASEEDISDTPQLDRGSDYHDFDANLAAPHSTPGLKNGVDTFHQSYEDKQDDTHVEGDEDLLNFDDEEEVEGEREYIHQDLLSSHPPDVLEIETAHGDSALNGSDKAFGDTKGYHNLSGHSENQSSSQALEGFEGRSHLAVSAEDSSALHADEAPSTPSGGKNGSKRKALEDEDDFDLFDTVTPDKKRRRPSR